MSRLRWPALGLVVVLVGLGFPGVAEAHGPVAPIASSYLARVTNVPPGVDAKVVDGDQRMWLRAVPGERVVVLDYRGAPYLRFARSGIEVNQNSAMYYLNQTPVAETPPPDLTRTTPPRWQRVSGAHDYGWHDGRLHALATVALSPGVAFVGRWSIPVLIDGHIASISGGLWHANSPSIVWFWPIVVLLLCVLAAWRVRHPGVDRWTARVLGFAALAAAATTAVGWGLHGRPTVSILQLVELGIVAAFVLWGLVRVLSGRAGYFSYFVIALVALWEGALLIPTLVPAFVARVAAVLGLGAGVGLLLLVFRLSDLGQRSRSGSRARVEEREEDDDAWELA
jgi:hypothetical protein